MMEVRSDRKPEELHGSRNPRARKLRSLVWNDFTKEQKADGSYFAICNHCKKQLVASSRSGTTHLRNHLRSCLNSKKPMKRRKLLVRRLTLKSNEASKSDVKNDEIADLEDSHFDQESSRRDLARMIILHGYPFSIVQQIGFQTFVNNLQPRFKLESYDSIRADCLKIYNDARFKLHGELEKLSCRVNLTVDTWRSSNDAEYLCLTCHYVDNDWKLQQRILAFSQIDSAATGEEISKAVMANLYEWNIDQKLNSIIFHSCSYGDIAAQELVKYLSLKGSLRSNGDLFHVHSCQRLLNLIVQVGLEHASNLTDRVRESVQYVRSSLERLKLFQKAAKQVGAPQKLLVLDDPSNWRSLYLMLERACEYQEAFSYLAEWDGKYINPLSSRDWINVKAFAECLEVFYNALEKISAAKIPTANISFNDISAIHSVVKTWCTSPLPLIETVAKRMMAKFEDHLGMTRMVMAIASILDPRYKMKSIEYFFNLIYDNTYEANSRIENVRKCLINLYNEYVLDSAQTTGNQAYLCYGGTTGSCTSAGYDTAEESKTPSCITLSHTRRGLDQYLQETSSSQPIKSDLDLYLEEAVYLCKEGLDDSFSVLSWWKFNAAKYPILSIMARDVLAIPVSVAELEGEGRVLSQHTSSLDPVTMQALVCGQNWLTNEIEAVSTGGNAGMCLVPANAF